MKIELERCDYCKKIAETSRWDQIGWIHIEGELKSISISAGRNENNTANTFRYLDRLPRSLDFCGLPCFLKYLYLTPDGFNNTERTFEEKLQTLPPEAKAEFEEVFKKIGIDSSREEAHLRGFDLVLDISSDLMPIWENFKNNPENLKGYRTISVCFGGDSGRLVIKKDRLGIFLEYAAICLIKS